MSMVSSVAWIPLFFERCGVSELILAMVEMLHQEEHKDNRDDHIAHGSANEPKDGIVLVLVRFGV